MLGTPCPPPMPPLQPWIRRREAEYKRMLIVTFWLVFPVPDSYSYTDSIKKTYEKRKEH